MKYKGSCHCGQIAFEVEGELKQVIDCNCSICSRKGSLLWMVPRGNLNLLTRLEKPSGAYDQTYRIPANHIFVLGSHPRSYDSRYWGMLHFREVFARATPILF